MTVNKFGTLQNYAMVDQLSIFIDPVYITWIYQFTGIPVLFLMTSQTSKTNS